MKRLRVIVSLLLVITISMFSVQAVFAESSNDNAKSKLKNKEVSQLTPAEKELYYDSLLLDENGQELDPEEFATTKQFEAYYDRHNLLQQPTRGAAQFNTAALNLPTETVTQNNTYYKLHVGIFNHNGIYINQRVIQDIHVRGDDIYVTQHTTEGNVVIRHYIKGNYCQGAVTEYDNNNVQVSQYTTKMSDALEMQDYMIIRLAGHGTTLAAYTSPIDNYVYFLVCAGKPDPSDLNDSTTNKIGRIRYQAYADISQTAVQRMCNTNYATFHDKQPAGYDSLVSVHANISRDEQYLYMRVKWSDGTYNNILHTVYDLEAFDAILASTPSNTNYASFKNNSAAEAACVYSFNQYISSPPATDASAGRRSPFSFSTTPTTLKQLFRYNQGQTITPAGMIYNYTGNEVLNSQQNFDSSNGTYPTITRLRPSDKKVSGYRLIFNLPDSWFLNDSNQVKRPTFENEGLQMVTGHIYVGVSPKDGYENGTNRWVAYIFDIPNSGLSF